MDIVRPSSAEKQTVDGLCMCVLRERCGTNHCQTIGGGSGIFHYHMTKLDEYRK